MASANPENMRVFSPLQIRGISFKNRIMMSPMSQHKAEKDGRATDWHLVHYGSRAQGDVGLIMVEDCAVSPEGRLSKSSLGIYDDRHIDPLKRIVDYCHEAGARVGLQLGHAGRKAFRADGPPEGCRLIGATAEPFSPDSRRPVPMTDAEWDRVLDDYVAAAGRAVAAGFDAIEIHGAHGYLLHQALAAAGPVDGLDRAPMREVVRRVRKAAGNALVLFGRISAGSTAEGDLTHQEACTYSSLLEQDGIDVIDVSSGGLTTFVPGTQADPWPRVASAVRSMTAVCTVGLGGVRDIADAELLLSREACDLVGVGRALLEDSNWLSRQRAALSPDPPMDRVSSGVSRWS